MKERNKKIGSLINRYGLLSILGLGFSFIGTTRIYSTTLTTDGGSGATEESKKDPDEKDPDEEDPDEEDSPGFISTESHRVIAGGNQENVFTFDEKGNIGEKVGNASIFNGNGDFVQLSGEGNLVEIIFGKDFKGEPVEGSSAKATPSVEDSGTDAIKTFFGEGGEGKEVGTLVEDLIGAANNVSAKAAIEDIIENAKRMKVEIAEENLKIDDHIFRDVTDVKETWNELCDIVDSQVNGKSIKVGDGSAQNMILNSDNFFSGISAQAYYKIGDDEAKEISSGIAALAKLFGSAKLDDDILGIFDTEVSESIAKDLDKFIEELNVLKKLADKEDIKSIADSLNAYRNGNNAFQGLKSLLLSEKYKDLLDKSLLNEDQTFQDSPKELPNLEAGSPKDLKALVVVNPDKKSNKNQIWSVQITSVANDIDLTNPHGSGNFLKIDTENMNNDDVISLFFRTNNKEKTDVGRICIVSSDEKEEGFNKDITIRLLSDQNGQINMKNEITAPFNQEVDLYNHLNLEVAKVGESEEKEPLDFEFQKKVIVKNLTLGGTNSKLGTAVVDRDQIKVFDGIGGDTSCGFRKGLVVNENIVIKGENVTLKFGNLDESSSESDLIQEELLYLGGNLEVKSGVNFAFGHADKNKILVVLPENGGLDGEQSTAALSEKDEDKKGLKASEIRILKEASGVRLISGIIFAAAESDDQIYHPRILLGNQNKYNPAVFNVQNNKLMLEGIDEVDDGTKVNENEGPSEFISIPEKSYATIIGGDDKDAYMVRKNINSYLIRIGKDATLSLEKKLVLSDYELKEEFKSVYNEKSPAIIKAEDNSEIKITDRSVGTVTLRGNLDADKNVRITLVITGDAENSGTLIKWPDGDIVLPEGENVKISLDAKDAVQNKGLKALREELKNLREDDDAIFSISLEGNPNAEKISKSLVPSLDNPFIKNAKWVHEDNGTELGIDLSKASVSTLKESLGIDGQSPYISDRLFDILNAAAEKAGGGQEEEENRTLLEDKFISYLVGDDSSQDKAKVLASLSKTTTEEKNRATLALINSIRDTIYSKMGQTPIGEKHYNVWVSGFGDIARNGKSSEYKMNCDIFGFGVGLDSHINENVLFGLMAGYGKEKAKYKGDMILNRESSNKCDIKSYFGGIYGSWSNFVEDINVIFSSSC